MTSTYDTVLKTTAPARGPRAPKFAFPVLDRIVGATTTRVLNLDALTPTVVRWERERRAGYHFRASQHALLGVITTEGPDLRPLSLAGAPGDNHLEFATRAGPSALRQRVIGLRPGGIVKVSRPMGGLTYDPARAAIFIVGRIGTTPARSLLRATEYSTSRAPIRLLLSNRAADEIPFADEPAAISDQRENLSITWVLSSPSAVALPGPVHGGRLTRSYCTSTRLRAPQRTLLRHRAGSSGQRRPRVAAKDRSETSRHPVGRAGIPLNAHRTSWLGGQHSTHPSRQVTPACSVQASTTAALHER